MDRFVSRFTPSLTPPETLEAMFVQRHDLAETLVERIRESVLTRAKHHSLLVGPRGIGKTHLVSLVYHRVKAFEDLGDDLVIAWLHEEEWGIASFLDLLFRILRALYREYGDSALEADVEALYLLDSADQAQARAEVMLREYVGDRTLLVLIENLDDVFDGLQREGQQQFRAYLQQYPFTTVLATSQSLFKGVSDRSFPFYGFFKPNHLDPFSLDDAAALLTNIATHEGKADLAAYIPTPEGRARIRAVHHLAGGNPRVYVILSQFLTRESMDSLVEPFMLMLDDLTPYYQSRMASLSAQQRKIIEVLIEYRAALPVKQIASRCFITPQTTSGQLRTLRELGYVQSVQAGRESYYELREPLMRFSLEMKKHRGGPIRLFIDFLRIWYTRPELELQLESLRVDARVDREYLVHALSLTEAEPESPVVAACLADFERHFAADEYEQAQRAADELVVIRGTPSDWHKKSVCLSYSDKYKEAFDVVSKAFELKGSDPHIYIAKAIILYKMKRLKDLNKLIDEIVASDMNKFNIEVCVGTICRMMDRHELAAASFMMALRLFPDEGLAVLAAHSLVNVGRFEDALEVLEKGNSRNIEEALVLEGARARAGALIKTGQYDKALDVLQGPDLSGDERKGLQWSRSVAAFMTGDEKRGKRLLRELWGDEMPQPIGLLYAVAAHGRWADAKNALSKRGPVFEAMERLGEASDVGVWVMLLLSTFEGPAALLPERVRTLAEVSSEREDEPLVIATLSAMLGVLVKDSAEAVRAWHDAWAEVATERPAFAPAARVLGATLDYRETEDPAVLLRLPIEERKVLQQALGLEETDPAE